MTIPNIGSLDSLDPGNVLLSDRAFPFVGFVRVPYEDKLLILGARRFLGRGMMYMCIPFLGVQATKKCEEAEPV